MVTRQAQPVGKPVGHPGTLGLDIPGISRRMVLAKPLSVSGDGSNRDPGPVSGFGDGHTQIGSLLLRRADFLYLEDET